jgi:hypothetical protein
MAMNFAPLDCSCQGASSEPKKNLLGFFRFREIRKKPKIHIFGSHSKKWVQWPELLLYLNSTNLIQLTDSNLVRIGDKKFFEKTTYSPLLSNFHFGKSFKRP